LLCCFVFGKRNQATKQIIKRAMSTFLHTPRGSELRNNNPIDIHSHLQLYKRSRRRSKIVEVKENGDELLVVSAGSFRHSNLTQLLSRNCLLKQTHNDSQKIMEVIMPAPMMDD